MQSLRSCAQNPAAMADHPRRNHGMAARLRSLWLGVACLGLAACAPEGIPTEVADIVLPLPEQHETPTTPEISANPAIVGNSPTRRALAGAILRDPRILERAALVDVAVADINVAKGGYYPNFSLSAQASASANADGTTTSTPALALTAQQMLLDFGATDRDVAQQAINAGLGHLDFLGAVDTVLEEVLTEAANLRHDMAAIALTRDHIGRLEEIAALQAARDGAGFAAAPDQLDMNRSLTAAAADLARMDADAARAARKLAQLTGAANPLAPALDIADCRSDGTPLSLLSAQLTQEAAEIGVIASDRARLPTLYLEGSAQQPLADESPAIGMNLRLDTSLFSGGFEARRASARANLAAAGAASARAQEDAAISQSDALAEMADLARQAQAEAQDIETLAQMQEIYRDQYASLGTRSLTDLLSIAGEYNQAQIDILATERDSEIAVISCVAAQGGLRDALGLSDFALHGLTLRP